MKEIRLLRPTYDEQTKKELLEVLDSGWTSFGPKVKEFEEEFARYVGTRYAVATNSATSALDLCLKAYGIKGGELITPAFTFTSDAHVGEWNGMDVTFADIDPDTFCVDPESLHITPKTRAIVAVDCHGRLADISGIRSKIEKAENELIPCTPCTDGILYSVYTWEKPETHSRCNGTGFVRLADHPHYQRPLVIEDAAHAMYTLGAGAGDIVVYSFQAVKSMPIYDGGMVTTNDETIYKKLRQLTWLGIEKNTYDRAQGGRYEWDYDITSGDGIKAYMTPVQAVIGLGQLRRLDQLLAKRQRIQERYNKAFDGQPWFQKPRYSHTVQYYSAKFDDRNGLSAYLAECRIHTSVHFKPLHEMSYWKKAKKYPLPNTDALWPKLLSLPVHDALTEEQQDYVIRCVKDFYAKRSV